MNYANKTALVTGGTGFIGGRLIERLILEQGAKVHALVRNFSHASRIARFDQAQMFPGDTSDAAAVGKAIEGCDVVFHCAHDFAPAQTQNNLAGTRAILEAARHKRCPVVFLSTIDVYGHPAGGDIAETNDRNPAGSAYAENKTKAETLALEYHKEHGVAVTVLQPTIVYGPFSRPWTTGPATQVSMGQVVLPIQGEGHCAAVYIDDVIDAMLLAAYNDRAYGEAFLISGAEPVTWGTFYGAFEAAVGTQSVVTPPDEELERKLAEQLAKTNPKPTPIIRDLNVYRRIMQMPGLRNAAEAFPMERVPKHWRTFVRTKLLKAETKKKAGPKNPAAAERPLIVPDDWRLKMFKSRATVRIDKAREILGYAPQFDFERGMGMTTEFLRWANLA